MISGSELLQWSLLCKTRRISHPVRLFDSARIGLPAINALKRYFLSISCQETPWENSRKTFWLKNTARKHEPGGGDRPGSYWVSGDTTQTGFQGKRPRNYKSAA